MKTIKELEADTRISGHFEVGYKLALKDILELIDEFRKDIYDIWESGGLSAITEELKKRITGK